MGIFSGPKTPDFEPTPAPEPKKTENLTDPEALARARQRASDADRRKKRANFIVPLSTSISGVGTGLQI